MVLNSSDIEQITAVLGAPEIVDQRTWLWNLRNENGARVLAFTITIVDGTSSSVVVSAQSNQGYIELHDVSAYLTIEPDEVMFVAKTGDRFSSLVVGKTCTCSQFANIPASLLGEDLTEIDPTYLMAAMQLSLAEGILVS